MENAKHIHDIINWLAQNSDQYTVEQFDKLVHQFAGDHEVYNTCGGEVGVDEVLTFLKSRNKAILSEEGKVCIHPSLEMCDH